MTVSVQSDLFDDLRTATFVAYSRRASESTEGRACLVIRAKESRQPELYIIWHTRLEKGCKVTIRLDSAAAEQEQWWLSTDSEASFYPGRLADLLRRFVKTRRLLARTTPPGAPAITAEFDLRDFARLANRYRWVLATAPEGPLAPRSARPDVPGSA
jgi:hypothetical protein